MTLNRCFPSKDIYGDRWIDVESEFLVLAGRPEIDVVPVLSYATELERDLLLFEFAKGLDHVGDAAVEPLVPFDAVPSKYDRAALLVEELGLSLAAHERVVGALYARGSPAITEQGSAC